LRVRAVGRVRKPSCRQRAFQEISSGHHAKLLAL
jgi:hypothetical protein